MKVSYREDLAHHFGLGWCAERGNTLESPGSEPLIQQVHRFLLAFQDDCASNFRLCFRRCKVPGHCNKGIGDFRSFRFDVEIEQPVAQPDITPHPIIIKKLVDCSGLSFRCDCHADRCYNGI